MNAYGPYRAPRPSRRAPFAPFVGWTRPAAWALLAVGAIPPACTVYQLIADPGCPRWSAPPSPHVFEALALLAATLALGVVSWASQRAAARWVQRRARFRSHVAGFGVAFATLLPIVAAVAVGAFAAFWFYFTFAWHLCFDGQPFSFTGGC